VEKHF